MAKAKKIIERIISVVIMMINTIMSFIVLLLSIGSLDYLPYDWAGKLTILIVAIVTFNVLAMLAKKLVEKF